MTGRAPHGTRHHVDRRSRTYIGAFVLRGILVLALVYGFDPPLSQAQSRSTPSGGGSLVERAHAELKAGNLPEAHRTLQTFFAQGGTRDANSTRLEGRIAFEIARRSPDPRRQQRWYGRARSALEESVRLGGDRLDSLYALAHATKSLGDTAAALGYFDRAAALADGNAPVLLARARLLAEVGRPEDAEKRAREILESSPDHVATHLFLFDVLHTVGRVAEALDLAGAFVARLEATSSTGVDVLVRVYRAQIELALGAGDLDAVERCLRRVLELDAKAHWARLELGITQYRKGEILAAAQTLRDLIGSDSPLPASTRGLARFRYALCLNHASRHDEALVQLEAARLDRPRDIAILPQLTIALRRAGRLEEAGAIREEIAGSLASDRRIRRLQTDSARKPLNAAIQVELIRELIGARRTVEAKAAFDRFEKRFPAHPRTAALRDLLEAKPSSRAKPEASGNRR